MKQLTLLRHAKSIRKESALADFDRPLSKRGGEDAGRMGRWLRQRGLAPDLVLSSPAMRARATVEPALQALGLSANRLQYKDEIYEASPEALLSLLRGLDDTCGHVLLVGHNPGFTELWNRLAAIEIGNIPTGGAFSLNLPVSSWAEVGELRGEPAFMAVPKEIEALSTGTEKKEEKGKKKKQGCLHGKSEAKKQPGHFKCEKCGAVSAAAARLCRPGKIGKKK